MQAYARACDRKCLADKRAHLRPSPPPVRESSESLLSTIVTAARVRRSAILARRSRRYARRGKTRVGQFKVQSKRRGEAQQRTRKKTKAEKKKCCHVQILDRPKMSERAAGLRFASDSATLAPHVVIGHVDISSAGARVALLLREVLRRWAGPDKTQSHPGAVWATLGGDDNSGAVECARAWESTDPSQQMPPAAPLQVDTFHGSDGAAVLSIVCINAEVPGGSANAIALDLVRKIIADKVKLYSC